MRQEGEKTTGTATLASKGEKHHAKNSHIVTMINGDLELPELGTETGAIYIDVHDAKGSPISLPDQLEHQARKNFTIVNNPSKASYILHVTILHSGSASESQLKECVNSGFGGASTNLGSGGTALLADALLVTRRVPNEKKEKNTFLENVSARNALESAQMRIGLYLAGSPSQKKAARLEQELADILNDALH